MTLEIERGYLAELAELRDENASLRAVAEAGHDAEVTRLHEQQGDLGRVWARRFNAERERACTAEDKCLLLQTDLERVRLLNSQYRERIAALEAVEVGG